jgi:hypothetical protein
MSPCCATAHITDPECRGHRDREYAAVSDGESDTWLWATLHKLITDARRLVVL